MNLSIEHPQLKTENHNIRISKRSTSTSKEISEDFRYFFPTSDLSFTQFELMTPETVAQHK